VTVLSLAHRPGPPYASARLDPLPDRDRRTAQEDAMAHRLEARFVALGVVVTALAVVLATGGAAAKTALTVYTAIEADDLKKYAARFNEDNPDIEIKWVRDSTGVVTAKLLAEKANPQADVVWGLAATSLMVLKQEGMLLPYAPKGLEKLDAQFRDKDNPPAWVGMDAWVAAICFNTAEAQKKKLAKPTSWKDLTKPDYKGTIVMPNPASSGTGFLDVSSWLQLFGEKAGWEYMDGLHQNIGVYTHSGSKPCSMAAQGEYPIGISFEFRAARLKKQGAPIDIVFPSEGSGWDMETTGIVKGTKNLEAVKTFVDWTISEKAMKLYNEGYAVVAITKMSQPIQFLPDNMVKHMVKNDFEWAAANRKKILDEWQKRYDTKTEKK
jgi:iron(III) transport system substrate-binding protein